MGSSLAKLFRKEVLIMMVGLSWSGKTTILYKLKLGDTITTGVTVGFNIETLEYKNINFTVYDCGGQNVRLEYLRNFFKMVGGLVYVVDSNDRDRVFEARDDLHRLMREDGVRETPLLILANKQDLPGAMSVTEIKDKLDLHSLQQDCWHIQGASAPTGEGLEEGLEWLASHVIFKE